jgi:predicted glycosyltransferase
MARFVITSCEWAGFGHVHRSALIAQALLARDPGARVVLITGVAIRPPWLRDPSVELVRVPHPSAGPTDAVLSERARTFATVMERFAPDAVLVERQPFGLRGELRAGLERARARGTAIALGLTDVLGDPDDVAAEIAGPTWAGVRELFGTVVVYGERRVCDHVARYRVPIAPRYCGWVTEPVPPLDRQDDLLLVAVTEDDREADIAATAAAVGLRRGWRVVVVTDAPGDGPPVRRRRRGAVGLAAMAEIRHDGPPPAPLMAVAGAVVLTPSAPLMALALAAGCRPVLVRRRSPPGDHDARATRFADLDLADLVHEARVIDELGRELDRRGSPSAAPVPVRLCVTGADRVAAELHRLAAASAA